MLRRFGVVLFVVAVVAATAAQAGKPMAHGYPDWQPVVGNVAPSVSRVGTNVAADVIPAPGAGFRILVLHLYMTPSAAGSLGTVDEVTPGNGFVRNIAQDAGIAWGFLAFDFDGLPLGPGNKLRLTDAGGITWYVHAVYSIVPV